MKSTSGFVNALMCASALALAGGCAMSFADQDKDAYPVDAIQFIITGNGQGVDSFAAEFQKSAEYKDAGCEPRSLKDTLANHLDINLAGIKNQPHAAYGCKEATQMLLFRVNEIYFSRNAILALVSLVYPCNDPSPTCVLKYCSVLRQYRCAKDHPACNMLCP